MKIGVLGDTHIPDRGLVLPGRVGELFKGLDIILHVGDVTELVVLNELQEAYTLTFAVAGEGDSPEVHEYLDERRVVRFGARRIGMIHGHQFQEPARGGSLWRRLLGRRADPEALPRFLVTQFEEEVDAIVFGHTHRPYVRTHGGVLLFNPGSALPGGRAPASAGILDMGARNITGKIVYL